jgi:leader peptidase (prepilin peptidase)/N-methyltransferase
VLQAAVILACAAAGAAAGYLMFVLAFRDERTVLPGWWRIPQSVLTGVLAGVFAWRLGPVPELPAFLALAVFGVLLAAIDLRSKLLPNALVLPFAVTGGVLLLAAAPFGAGLPSLLGALIGGGSLFLLYLVLALISPAGLGMGDVKLAGVLGLYAGYVSPVVWMATALGGFVLGALLGIFLLVFTRSSRKTAFPFGPSMLAAAVAAVAGWA